EWDWAIMPSDQKHDERIAMLRAIDCEMMGETGPNLFKADFVPQEGKVLTLNISSGGMLVLMNETPKVAAIVKIYVPTPIRAAQTPTLAEVVWTRPVPLVSGTLHFVGLKFVI